MTINRHNYETVFLLYTDNELTVTEKKAVEDFVEANPDLQEELIMLQQSILKPDAVVFDNKHSLFKNETITGALQEKLLLLMDNELTGAEKKVIDELIKTDAAVSKEWAALQESRLLPDTSIIFSDKQSLYRKEPGRVIAFPWRRVAAAAVLIGIGIWGALLLVNNGGKVTNGGIVKNMEQKPTTGAIKPATDQPVISLVPPDAKKQDLATASVIAKPAPAAEIITHSPRKILQRLPKESAERTTVVVKKNKLPKPYSDNLNKIEGNETLPAYVINEKQPNNIANPGNNEIGKTTGSGRPAIVYASSTSFTDNSEDNDDRILFMDEDKVKKTKLGGIFRKVKRVLARNTNIKSGGNNIKVANLEFTIQ
ncbi:MAG: hypothetical protein WKI04_20305 [Ferruginibacter sp.]